MIQLLVEPSLTAITWWNNTFSFVSHSVEEDFWHTFLYNIDSVHWGFWAFPCALLGCRHRISVGLRSGHLQHLDFFFLFNNFVVELLLSFGSVSCCKAQFQSSCRCWTNGIVFDSSILWYTEEFMYMLHSWYEVLVLICCFFSTNVALFILAKHFLLSHCPKDLVPELL